MSTATQPLWAVTPEKIQEAVRRIVEATHPLKIIMFGSQARGGADLDSDLDILVVEREVPDRYAEIVRLLRVLRGLSSSGCCCTRPSRTKRCSPNCSPTQSSTTRQWAFMPNRPWRNCSIWRYEDLPLSASFDRNAALEWVRKIRAFVETQIGPQ